MLIFFLYTVFYLIGLSCGIKIFHLSIQPEQALDMIFGWQKMLNYLYESQSKLKNLLGKALGDCEKCMSFWASVIATIIYRFTIPNWEIKGALANMAWLIVFHSICTILSLFIITQLFSKRIK